jgi:hypothetical protein
MGNGIAYTLSRYARSVSDADGFFSKATNLRNKDRKEFLVIFVPLWPL